MTDAQLALLKHCRGYLRTKKYQKSGVFLRGAQVTRARILQAVPYPSSTRKTKDIRETPMLKDLAREVEAHPVGDSWYWKIGEGVYQDKLKQLTAKIVRTYQAHGMETVLAGNITGECAYP